MGDVAEPPAHGGDLHRAALRYGRPLGLTDPEQAWIDLSAALNPRPYPMPAIEPAASWQLPGDLTTLLAAARACYSADQAVAVPGSQAAIQWLPLLRPCGRVAVPVPGYREHGFRWQWAGHEVVPYDPGDSGAIEALLTARGTAAIDVLVTINPNNPSGDRYAPELLLDWWQRLATRGGWLVVDEAFADTQPQESLAAASSRAGLVVLRSLGKFFGLPGIRCGFVLCDAELARRLTVAVGPWPLSAATVEVAQAALADRQWQQHARQQLQALAAINRDLLRHAFGSVPLTGTDLFTTLRLDLDQAVAWQERLAVAGIWTRLIETPTGALLRSGLVDPENGVEWERYRAALGVQ